MTPRAPATLVAMRARRRPGALVGAALPLLLLLAGAARSQEPATPAAPAPPEAPAGPGLLGDLRLRLELPRYGPAGPEERVRSLTLTSLPPGAIVLRYEGLHGLVVRTARNRLRALARGALREAWQADVLSDDEYERELTLLFETTATGRAVGAWWDRPWRDARTPERGGAPAAPHEEVVGEPLEARIGPVRLSSELRLELDGLPTLEPTDVGPLHLSGEAVRASDFARLRRDPDDADDAVEALEVVAEEPWSSLRAGEPRLALPAPRPWTLPWRLTLRPAASIHPTAAPSRMLRHLTLRANLDLFDHLLRRVLRVRVGMRYRTLEDEVILTLDLVIFEA